MMRIGLILPLLTLGCAVADIVRPGEDARFNAISAGDSHTCALTDDGVAWCWGSNSHGQLGISGGHESEARPAAVNATLHYRAISAGRQHTCAIDLEGNLWCWGANDSGQLGDGTWQDRDVPGLVTLPATAVQYLRWESSFLRHRRQWSCPCAGDPMITANPGRWPEQQSGCLLRSSGAPVASRVSVGDNHSCAAGTAGLFCWGANDRVQLGSATLHESPVPVRVSVPSLASDVATGAAHACAMTVAQQVVCWGDNRAVQLGQPGTGSIGTAVPVPLPGLFFEAVGAGGSQSCAAARGEVWCWGEATDPKLGPVATIPHKVPEITGPISHMSVGARPRLRDSAGSLPLLGRRNERATSVPYLKFLAHVRSW